MVKQRFFAEVELPDWQLNCEKVAEKLNAAIKECKGIPEGDKSLATSDINRMVADLMYRLQTDYASDDTILFKDLSPAWMLYDAFIWKHSTLTYEFWSDKVFSQLHFKENFD